MKLSLKTLAHHLKDLYQPPMPSSGKELVYCANSVVCGHCLVTLSITSYRNIKMALIAAHLNAGIILVVTV